MATNYTPLTVSEVRDDKKKQEGAVTPKKDSFDVNVIFLGLIVITLAILSVLLFLLIQKKMQELSLVLPYFA